MDFLVDELVCHMSILKDLGYWFEEENIIQLRNNINLKGLIYFEHFFNLKYQCRAKILALQKLSHKEDEFIPNRKIKIGFECTLQK